MTDDRLRVCVVEPTNGGGLVHFAYQLCTALASEGADVTLIVGTEYELNSLPHNFRIERLLHLWKGHETRTQHTLSNPCLHLWKKAFRAGRRMVRALRYVLTWCSLLLYLMRTRPCLIQFSHFDHSVDALFVPFLRSLGFTLSQVCHEFEAREGSGWLDRLLARLFERAYHSFSAIFLLSQNSQEHFLERFPSIDSRKTSVIPIGNSEWLLHVQAPPGSVNLRERYGLRAGDQTVLFFGLLAPSKGVETLIDAFHLLPARADTRLVIAGYPTKHFDMPTIRRRIERLGIGDRTVLDLRYVPLEEIGALMDLATVVVYPYRSSTQSASLQVAYTFGKPVIAMAVGGLPEVVEDGKSGFLVPPDSPEALAEKISVLIHSPARAREMGCYARHLSSTRFTWDRVARQMMTLYKTF